MKRKKYIKSKSIKRLVILILLVVIVLTSPNIFLIINQNNIPTDASPLYHTYIVQFQDNDHLCIATNISRLSSVLPTLRIKFALDGEVIPFISQYWQRMTLSNLTVEYESDVICTRQKVQTGNHELVVISYNDLWNVQSTKIEFMATDDRYIALSN